MTAGVGATTIISMGVDSFIGYRSVGFLYLSSVLLISFMVPTIPTFFAAILSAITWNYVFIPEKFNFVIEHKEDLLMLVSFILSALATGTLTSQIRRQERLIKHREERTLLLYRAARLISDIRDRAKLLDEIEKLISIGIGRQIRLVLTMAAAENAPSDSDMKRLPLKGAKAPIGYLEVEDALARDDEELLVTLCDQIAVAVERLEFEGRAQETARLQESERLHQTLLNSISHELRTPLTTILTSAAALKNDEELMNTKSRQLASEIRAAGQRLDRLIANLLDMSRLEGGAMSLRKELHDALDLIGVAVNAATGESNPPRIQTDVETDLPLIEADFGLLVHAAMNLIYNALIYSPPESPVLISARRDGKMLKISVSDKGPGVPPHLLERIFDKFFRLPGSRTGGTGLGLTIAKNIVELHKGQLRAENQPAGGLCVSFFLPIAEAQPT